MIDINIKDYTYPLTEERIAKYPLEKRDESKLLRFRPSFDRPQDFQFKQIAELLPEKSLLVYNNTKVVPARLFFQKATGAVIEIFCLEPNLPVEHNLIFAATKSCRWQCIIGNAKRWREHDVLGLIKHSPEVDKLNLTAVLISREGMEGIVELNWEGDLPFSQVLELCGKLPIPPYLNRETEEIDLERYQTLYAQIRGSVAAPTAGLHFSEKVLEEIKARGIESQDVCLHVGAGTFLPVKTEKVAEHNMHSEFISVKKELIQVLLQEGREIVAVGTTSMRSLESLYYIGVSCIEEGKIKNVEQWAPYEREYKYSKQEALQAILDYCESNKVERINAHTKIIIVPSFEFRIVDHIVTNFHQSESTLLLLIAAFVGERWREIYDHALANNYRFLSYGDSSFLSRK